MNRQLLIRKQFDNQDILCQMLSIFVTLSLYIDHPAPHTIVVLSQCYLMLIKDLKVLKVIFVKNCKNFKEF